MTVPFSFALFSFAFPSTVVLSIASIQQPLSLSLSLFLSLPLVGERRDSINPPFRLSTSNLPYETDPVTLPLEQSHRLAGPCARTRTCSPPPSRKKSPKKWKRNGSSTWHWWLKVSSSTLPSPVLLRPFALGPLPFVGVCSDRSRQRLVSKRPACRPLSDA